MQLKNPMLLPNYENLVTKKKFYMEAVNLYKAINLLMGLGDKTALRKMVTEQMHSRV
ncbi:hypothetical protein Hdeb2414_s0023g00637391 [Helianthus debilis subsp. tardiflorus]